MRASRNARSLARFRSLAGTRMRCGEVRLALIRRRVPTVAAFTTPQLFPLRLFDNSSFSRAASPARDSRSQERALRSVATRPFGSVRLLCLAPAPTRPRRVRLS
eukprot:5887421-Pleurochrysis_carterae.AAC.1